MFRALARIIELSSEEDESGSVSESMALYFLSHTLSLVTF